MGFRFSGGGCCCGCPTAYADSFERADSATVGADWTEISGTWDIDTNALECTSAGSVVNSYSDADDTYVVICTVHLATNGDKARVMLGRQDANNYVYAQVHRTGTTTVELKTYKVQGGTHTQLAARAAITVSTHIYILKACWDGDTLRFGAEIREVDTIEDRLDSYNSQAGLVFQYAEFENLTGTYGSGHGLEVDTVGTAIRFGYYELFDPSSEDTTCPFCIGECTACGGDNKVAQYYSVTLAGFGGGYDGTYIIQTGIDGPCEGSTSAGADGTLYLQFTGFAATSCIMVRLAVPGITYCWRTAGIAIASFLCMEFDDKALVKRDGTEIGFFPCCNNGGGFTIPPAGDVTVTSLGD